MMQKIISEDLSQNEDFENKNAPMWIWFLLFFAVVGVSCAGTMFQQIDEIPPLLRASWRLQSTSLTLLPPAIWQWIYADEIIKVTCLQYRTLLILCLSGLAVAAHFGCWVASLDMTTLTHSLLFVSSHPILVAIGMYLAANLPDDVLNYLKVRGIDSIKSPNNWEALGVCLGLTGAVLTLLDEGDQQGAHTATFAGDAVAFMGAVTFIVYQVCGRVLRKWMPIFIYAFPVTLLGSLLLLSVSAAVEEKSSEFGVVGWATRKYIWWYIALSLIAGLLGHTGLNTCLSYLSPLVVCSSTMLEPMIGSFVGYIVFDGGLPGTWTTLGGFILICSMMLVAYGNHNSEADGDGEDKDKDGSIELITVLSQNDVEEKEDMVML